MKRIAPEADLRTDLPKYRIYQRGQLTEEVSDIRSVCQDDFVSILIKS